MSGRLCGLSGAAGLVVVLWSASSGLPRLPVAAVLALATLTADPVECLVATGGGFFDDVSLNGLHTLTYIYIRAGYR